MATDTGHVPIGNKLHSSPQILNIMHSRAGKAYDEATVQEDVRRLYNTRWFTPSGIRRIARLITERVGGGAICQSTGWPVCAGFRSAARPCRPCSAPLAWRI